MKNTKEICYDNIIHKIIVLFALIQFFASTLFSQTTQNSNYIQYINSYKNIAISNMKKYKIPASIILAQGLLESNAGKGVLAGLSNNHFGIKCNNDWVGERIYHEDDIANDCFRKYNHPMDSFDDHAKFLQRPRYSSLFLLNVTDYKEWAKGLQKCGYATDKNYANKLIGLIENYNLHLFDQKGGVSIKEEEYIKIKDDKIQSNFKHIPYKTQGLVYVIAENGDTYLNIALEFGFKVKDLYKYNEVPSNFPLKSGDLVYFQKKKLRADSPYFSHVVKKGDSMHSISQLYGIQVNSLYKINKKNTDYIPQEGDILSLR